MSFKRIAAAALALCLLICLFPTVSAQEDKLIVTKDYVFTAEGATVAFIDGNEIKPFGSQARYLTVNIVISGCDGTTNALFIGDKNIGMIANGVNTFTVKAEDIGDEAILLIRASTADCRELIYGSYNLDDIEISSCTIQFEGGDVKNPDEYIYYLPVAGDKGVTEEKKPYGKAAVGDGWNATTGLGGTAPTTPVMLGIPVAPPKNGVAMFTASGIADGAHEIVMKNGENTVKTVSFVMDNTPPEITTEFRDNRVFTKGAVLTFDIADTNLSDGGVTASLDGIPFTGTEKELSALCVGGHSLYVRATDAAGNMTEKSFLFRVAEDKPFTIDENGVLRLAENASAEYFTASEIIEINAYSNKLEALDSYGLRDENEQLIPLTGCETTASGAIPYQAFVAEVGEASELYLSYKGIAGSDGSASIVLEAFDHGAQEWKIVGVTNGADETGIRFSTAGLVKDGKLRLRARQDFVSNGSDTLTWISDTQYYTRYDDLNYLYSEDLKYIVEQFSQGKTAYCVHTGDLVDQTQIGDEEANKEFAVASECQKILEEAGVPHGVVSGNHDVQHTLGNYEFFEKWFGAQRYESFPWFGGQIKNNTHHFDLVTIGGYEFVFLYIGCYDETDPAVLAWANEVLSQYSDRNAVICTHEYLQPSGKWSGDRAQVIWEKLVVPNENVKMVLCGHVDGVCDNLREVGESGRKVLEILADYQFAELGNEISHIENAYTCDGEGYLKILRFNKAKQVVASTYTPVFDDYDYYASYQENFVYDLDLITPKYTLKTEVFRLFANPVSAGAEMPTAENDCGVFATVSANGADAVTRLLGSAKSTDFAYTAELQNDNREYAVNAVREGITGFEGVSPSLRCRTAAYEGWNDNCEVVLDLMPTDAAKLRRTSGNSTYSVNFDGNGFTFVHDGSEANWVTLASTVNKKINITEANRLYFSVEANKNTKWNLYVNISGKEALNFSQYLYKEFGCGDTAPSDIVGSWTGYIDLTPYVTGDVTVASIYAVVATGGSEVRFNSLFLGKPTGETVTFVTSENIAQSFDYANADSAVNAPANPSLPNMQFDGWFTDSEFKTAAAFPAKAGDSAVYYAKMTEKTDKTAAKTIYDEVDIVGERVYNSKVVNPLIYVAIAIILVAVAAVLFVINRKKKEKTNEKTH